MRGRHGTGLVARRATGFAMAALMAAALAMTLWADAARAATFTVTNTSDSGPGSLRQAITDANANANPGARDTIGFAIPAATDPGCVAASGVCTISPAEELPEITEPVIINGYSQAGASPNTLLTGNNADLKIELSGGGAGVEDSGFEIFATNSVVRGLIINGWDGIGIWVLGPEASGNRIEGNFVGTNAAGTAAVGNGDEGVQIRSSTGNVVGGASAAARNVISGNDDDGVVLNSGTTNRVQGNYIGTDASGQSDLGNGDEGVRVLNARNTVVGGNAASAGNTIAYNAGDGVDVDGFAEESGDPGTGNSILRNSIFSNGELGIDLDSDNEDANDVTPNDPQDPDPGPNLLQNFPVLSSAQTPDGNSLTVRGTLNSNPTDSFSIQFFSSPEADPSGFGEGRRYLGQANVVANAGGNAAFSFSSANASVPSGYVVTATATNSVTGDTSEFSRAIEVEDDTPPRVISTSPPDRATGVIPGTNVSAAFSEQMRASTINTNTFRLFRKVGPDLVQVPATVSYSPGTRRGVLNPNANLQPGSQYVARVYLGARDLANNPLAEVRTFTFFVRE